MPATVSGPAVSSALIAKADTAAAKPKAALCDGGVGVDGPRPAAVHPGRRSRRAVSRAVETTLGFPGSVRMLRLIVHHHHLVEWSHVPTKVAALNVRVRSVVSAAAVCVILVLVTASAGAAYTPAEWAVLPRPGGIRYLADVACTSSRACTIIGSSDRGLMAGRWNGAEWSIESVLNVAGASESILVSVSCPASRFCVAVGSYDDHPHGVPISTPLVERWDGTRWTIQKTPRLGGGPYHGLQSVSCTSRRACTAVGYTAGDVLVERWNGRTWSIQTTPHPAGSLSGVSCTSSTACTAVGETDSGESHAMVAERWDGAHWSIEATPQLEDGAFSDVSCTSSTACTAVGSYFTAGMTFTLAERWDGIRWSIQTTPNRQGVVYDSLSGVSCTSNACTAVGGTFTRYETSPQLTLAEHWDGTNWVIQATPNPYGGSPPQNILVGVSCTLSMACMAVGNGGGSPLVESTVLGWATLTGIPPGCVRLFFPRVQGTAISSVGWSLDGRRIPDRPLRQGTRYEASISLSPGPHRLTVTVAFVNASHTPASILHRSVTGCPLVPPSGLG